MEQLLGQLEAMVGPETQGCLNQVRSALSGGEVSRAHAGDGTAVGRRINKTCDAGPFRLSCHASCETKGRMQA